MKMKINVHFRFKHNSFVLHFIKYLISSLHYCWYSLPSLVEFCLFPFVFLSIEQCSRIWYKISIQFFEFKFIFSQIKTLIIKKKQKFSNSIRFNSMIVADAV